ncbi:hypothetical protein [Mycobacterium mantenii]|uniref:hypothetical protein n=1 Tax=Mycobacterium mantenii TaxID=560555 RepID=UPI0038CC06EC
MTSPDQAPLIARPAATVMLIRDDPGGIAVFLMRRHAKMEFALDILSATRCSVSSTGRSQDHQASQAR